MTDQPSMFEPHFNGSDYVPERDYDRLKGQLGRVFNAVRSGEWLTLDEIHRQTGDPHASISAQLRHLRKPRFGGWIVEKRLRGESLGLWEYRLLEPLPAD
jgi:hypothetical protein